MSSRIVPTVAILILVSLDYAKQRTQNVDFADDTGEAGTDSFRRRKLGNEIVVGAMRRQRGFPVEFSSATEAIIGRIALS